MDTLILPTEDGKLSEQSDSLVKNLEEGSQPGPPSSNCSKFSRASSISSTRFQKFIVTFTSCFETFFFKWGYMVASYPFQSITACILFTIICGMGLMNFTYEDRPDKLLIPQASQLAFDTDWLRNNFPTPVRFSAAMLISEDNVLVPEVIQKLMDIQERVETITVNGRKWDEVCFQLPITKSIPTNKRRRRELLEDEDVFADDFFTENDNSSISDLNNDPFYDSTLSLPDEIYCSFVESLDKACWQITPLELWGFNRTTINNITQQDIIEAINTQKVSPVFGRPVNYTAELGGEIVTNEKGQIVKAQAIMFLWSIKVNKTAIQSGQAVRDDGTGELADEISLKWESEWIKVMDEYQNLLIKENNTKVRFQYANGRSFGDIYKNTMYNDMKIVIAGYAVMFAYVAIMLGRFNMIEQRPYLSMAGITCAILAGVVTCGICSAFGLAFGNVNKVLPFLLLGIGVDDMFVIMQCWKNLYPNCLTEKYKESLPTRIGMALKTSGASITVTSLTDMAAFAIGATTLLPGLKSFCIYAAVGIIAVFIFQVTFFVGWLAIDQKRLESRRNAFFFCKQYSSQDFIPNLWSQTSYLQVFFEKILAKLILSKIGKGCVIVITGIFLAVNINGNLKLRQEFDPMWFLAQDSHLVKYMNDRKIFFPNFGFNGFMVGDNVNWTASFNEFDDLVQKLKGIDAVHQFDPWYDDFKKYCNRNYGTDIPNKPLSHEKFQKYLGRFLFSRIGSKYRFYFKAEKELTCGERASHIQISMMPFKFKSFKGRDEHIPGMNEVKALVKNANMTFNSNGRLFPWSPVFVSWETDEIITDELYRNVTLSLACVLITIYFLLFDLRVCLYCGVCVIFTVIDVGGVMYYWGMSIDTISLIATVVAIGLCVDYAAHIGLAFLTATGSKNSRATQALRNIGPAVLNGGFSTFLAIILLANSESHALKSFFKVLTAVVFFGLFHGLVFLPVLLSMLGPDPYPTGVNGGKGQHSPKDDSGEKRNFRELKPLSKGSGTSTGGKTSANGILYDQVDTD